MGHECGKQKDSVAMGDKTTTLTDAEFPEVEVYIDLYYKYYILIFHSVFRRLKCVLQHYRI